MKIRIDFVTNSSSSSFVSIKKMSLPIELKNGKKKECIFTLSKKDKKTTENVDAKEFKFFSNEFYLLTGSKPTVSKIMKSKKLQSEFGKFLEEKNGYKARLDSILLEDCEYRIGYGESMGDDFENETRYLKSRFHPILRELLKDRNFLTEYNGVRFLDLMIKYNRITYGKQVDSFYQIDINPSYSNKYTHIEYPFNIEFYHSIDAEFQFPDLSPTAMQNELRSFGFTTQMINDLENGEIRIVYVDYGSGKNDVFAYSYNGVYSVVLTRHILNDFDIKKIKNFGYTGIGEQLVLIAEKSSEIYNT